MPILNNWIKMTEDILLTQIDARGVATLTLNRPSVHNAFNDDLIAQIADAFTKLGADPKVRVIILTGNGKSFCAGADLNWMNAMVGLSEAENVADATRLSDMFYKIYSCPKPTIAKVQGAALAGGVGLISVCDMAISVENAKFGITEVKLGVIPANIALYLLPRIGIKAMQYYGMTGLIFTAFEALKINLIDEVTSVDGLDRSITTIVNALLAAAPQAVTECKKLIQYLAGGALINENRLETAKWLARVRISDEAQGLMNAFLKNRSAS